MNSSTDDNHAIDLALAEWLAKLGRADGDRYRAPFETWLSQDPRRQAAYDAFSTMDRDIARTSLPVPPLHRATPSVASRHFAAVAIAALVLVAVGGGGVLLLSRTLSHSVEGGTLLTAGNAPRAIDLPNGVSVMLDAHAVIRTSLEESKPVLFVEDGRVRVRLPADTERPFVVAAGDLRLTAHGAVFDIAKGPDAVRVTALSGAIVARHEGKAQTSSLAGGKQLVAGPAGDTIMTAPKDESGWTTALLPLDGKTLGDLVTIGNRRGGKVIRLGDAALADRPVQGQLPVKDTHTLAMQIAAAFDLDVHETPDEYILTKKS